MDNSIQKSEKNVNLHIKLNVKEPDSLICTIILTIIPSVFLYFSPYLYLVCLYTPAISSFDIWIIYIYNLNKTISST